MLLVAFGVASAVAGEAMIRLKLHHTIGYGGLAIGVVCLSAGLVGALWPEVRRALKGGLRGVPVLGWRPGRKTQSILALAIIVGATMGTYVYVDFLAASQSGPPNLSLQVSSATETAFPDGRIGVNFLVNALGGSPPYTFTAVWGDLFNQTSTTGNFTRVFSPTTPVSDSLAITAKGPGKELGGLSLQLPAHIPVVLGTVNSQKFDIASGGAQGNQFGGVVTATQTARAGPVIVSNVSSRSVAVTSAVATSTSITATLSTSTVFTSTLATSTFTTSNISTSTSPGNGGPSDATIAFMHLFAGVATSPTSQGTANVFLVIMNHGQATSITSLTITGGGLSAAPPVYLCSSTVSCSILQPQPLGANSVTTFTDDRTALYVGSPIQASVTYSFTIQLSSGQSIVGTIVAE